MEEATQNVQVMFSRRRETTTQLPRSFWQKIFGLATVRVYTIEENVPITVEAVVEDQGDFVTLWMTQREAKPLQDAKVYGLQQLTLPMDRSLVLHVPKANLQILPVN